MERPPAKQVCVVLPVKNGAHHLAATVAALDAALEEMEWCSFTPIAEVGGAHPPSGVVGCALASSLGSRTEVVETASIFVPRRFSARARKTAPEGGCAPQSVGLRPTPTPEFGSTILVAENGSTDSTPALAMSLAQRFPRVRVLCLPAAGRGGALRAAWASSPAAVLAYMDVDLATDLVHLPELLESVLQQRADIAIGSRLKPPRQTRRGWRRELLSRGYSELVGRYLGTGFQDAQCGFKAVSRRVVEILLPLVEDQQWFFDTELLTLAEHAGCRIHEFPVRWQDHAETSTVRVVPTILQMLRGMARLKRRLRNGLAEEARARWQVAGLIGAAWLPTLS